MRGSHITLRDLSARARRYESGFLLPPEERKAVGRQTVKLFGALLIFGALVLLITLLVVGG